MKKSRMGDPFYRKESRSILPKMMLTFLFSFLLFVTSWANPYSLNSALNLKLDNGTIQEVIQQIEDQTDFFFLYQDAIFEGQRVTINAKDASLESILKQVAEQTGIGYAITDRQIILKGQDELTTLKTVAQQTRSVKGTVTSTSGEPIPGATVVVKGTSNGTITDFDGNYILSDVPADAILQISFVGMKTQEVSVAGKEQINIALEEETIGLEEVVAIGYGVVKKKDLTGAVSSVKSEELKQNPVANVAQALQGKLSGVSVVSQDGRPGASVNIRIRGGGSITQSNDPLVVVDGVPGVSLEMVPADQIESIDVLKDASSTAIYGARGANGVILVTTKGLNTKKGTTQVSYSGYYQTKKVAETLDVLNSQEYLLHQWSYMTAYGGSGESAQRDAMENYYGLGTKYGNHYADYANVPVHDYTQDLLRTAMTQEHNISVASATEKTTMAFSANMINDEGIKIKSGFKRYNANLKLEQQLYDGVKVGFNVDYVQSRTEGLDDIVNGEGSILSKAYTFAPIDTEDILRIGGNADLTQAAGFGNGDVNLDQTYNPYTRTMDIYNIEYFNRIRATGYVNWDIIDGLTFRTEVEGLRGNTENQYYDAGVAFADENNRIADRGATLTLERAYKYRTTSTLNWQVKNLGDDHTMSVLGGFEMMKDQQTNSEMDSWGMPANFDFETAIAKIQFAQYAYYDETSGLYEIAKSNFYYFNDIDAASTTTSAFARVNYSYKSRYLVTATMRADGSSKFAPNKRWGYFPAGAFAWRVSDEAFLENTRSWLDNLKLRLSVGSSGSDDIPYDAWNALYDVDFSANGNIKYDPKGVLPNPDLKWETTISRNLGLDYGLFDGHIYGTIEYYWNNTKDLLGEIPVNPVSGFTTQFQNIGKTSNKGIEISLGADIIRQTDFALSFNVTYNYNKNNIDQLAEGIITDYGTDWNSSSTYPRKEFLFKEGTPVGTVIGYKYDGFYTPDDFDYNNGIYTLKDGVVSYENFNQIGNYPSPFTNKVFNSAGEDISTQIFPGALKMKDTNGDGKITTDDPTELGEIIPRHTGGFALNANYKGIDFSANFSYALGGHVYNIASLLNTTGRKDYFFGANRAGMVRDAYKVYDVNASGDLVGVTDPAALNALNANAKYHLPYYEFGLTLDKWFEKSDYLRLNSLTIGYTLPKRITQQAKIQRLRFYATGGNLFTITGYSGLDPEVNTDEGKGAYPTPGLDFGAYPRARTFTFGVNVDF